MSTNCEASRSLHLWPDWRPERIVFDDGAIIAVDKPAGVPSQAPDPQMPDDVVERLSRYLAGRDGERPYLGVHQRLDRDTSGVLVFARSRDANPGLARQFEGRTVVKRYLAAVRGFRGNERTLRGRIAKGEGGRMRIVSGAKRGSRARAGKEAVTHVRVLERRGDRCLVSLRIETGRTHQIRVQLAHLGCPVAGDRMYGGPAASRLLLHASELQMDHPLTGRPLSLRAPVPDELARWLAGEDATSLRDGVALRRAVERAAEARWGLARVAAEAPAGSTCFRLLDGAGDGVPNLALDVYGDFLVAHLYEDLDDAERESLLDVLGDLGFEGVYLKRHPRQANELVDAVALGLAPPAPVRGRAAPDPLAVTEHGVAFEVHLGDGLGTGLFLDQRDNRRRVRELAPGRRVLNLFAHTCAFTVAAAAGGAAGTVSIDASKTALERGRRQVLALGVPPADHLFVHADVFEQLEALAEAGERFDLVLVDPPTYSRTRASRWRSGSDWRRLAAAVVRVTAPGGLVLACSNDRRLPNARLRRYLHEAAREVGRSLSRLRDLPVPRDFPPPPEGPSPLKSLLATVA